MAKAERGGAPMNREARPSSGFHVIPPAAVKSASRTWKA